MFDQPRGCGRPHRQDHRQALGTEVRLSQQARSWESGSAQAFETEETLLNQANVSLCKQWIRSMKETIDHPEYYGGADNPYEVIKVVEAWSLSFCLGNVVKYIARA